MGTINLLVGGVIVRPPDKSRREHARATSLRAIHLWSNSRARPFDQSRILTTGRSRDAATRRGGLNPPAKFALLLMAAHAEKLALI
jgi:hypothetical protein